MLKSAIKCLFLCLLIIDAHQSDAFDVKPSFSTIPLNEYCQIFHTPDSLGPQAIDSLIKAKAISISKFNVSPGFSQDYYWLKFDLKSADTDQNLLLELDNPHVNYAHLYDLDSSGFRLLGQAGDRLYYNDRTYDHRKMIFPITLTKQMSRSFLLMIDKRNAAVSFPLKLWDKDAFLADDQKKSISYGIYFGIVLFIAFTSILFGVFAKKYAILFYGIYALMLSMYFFTGLGYSFQYLYPWSNALNNYSRTILIMFIYLTFIEFTLTFFSIKITQRSIYLFYRTLQITLLAIFIVWPFFMELYEENMTIVLNILYAFFGLSVIPLTLVTYRLRKVQSQNVIVFLASFSFILLGSLATILMEYGLIPESLFFINPIMLGGVIEIISLTAYMIYRTQFLINEKQMAMEVTSELSQKVNELSTKIKTEEQGVLKLKSGAILSLNEIIYINSDGHYLEYYTLDKTKPEIDRNTLKKVQETLPEGKFIRIHRSTIINIAHIKAAFANEVLLNTGQTLTISRSYKTSFSQILSVKPT